MICLKGRGYHRQQYRMIVINKFQKTCAIFISVTIWAIILYLRRDFILKIDTINIRNVTCVYFIFSCYEIHTQHNILYRRYFLKEYQVLHILFFTCIWVARRLHLATIEVKIHMTHWLSQAQEHGRRVQHHYELGTVYVDSFIFLTVFEIRLCRIKS